MTRESTIRTAATLDALTREGVLTEWRVEREVFSDYYVLIFPGGERRWNHGEVSAFIDGIAAARTPTQRSLI